MSGLRVFRNTALCETSDRYHSSKVWTFEVVEFAHLITDMSNDHLSITFMNNNLDVIGRGPNIWS